jgi:hypothetical protein
MWIYGGKCDNADCKVENGEKEEKCEKKLEAYHGLREEELQI